MVRYDFDDSLKKKLQKLKDRALQQRIKKHIQKIIVDPDIGKRMKNVRK